MKELGPIIHSSCFTFESAHVYFKELARKQNFKNIAVSLAKRYQLLEMCNFADAELSPTSHPLFGTENQLGVFRNVNDAEKNLLRRRFDNLGLLPEIPLENIYKLSWITRYGTKYRKSAVLAFDVNSKLFPVFGILEQVWIIHEYVYFEVKVLGTKDFNFLRQSYLVEKSDFVHYFSYETLLDYNVQGRI